MEEMDSWGGGRREGKNLIKTLITWSKEVAVVVARGRGGGEGVAWRGRGGRITHKEKKRKRTNHLLSVVTLMCVSESVYKQQLSVSLSLSLLLLLLLSLLCLLDCLSAPLLLLLSLSLPPSLPPEEIGERRARGNSGRSSSPLPLLHSFFFFKPVSLLFSFVGWPSPFDVYPVGGERGMPASGGGGGGGGCLRRRRRRRRLRYIRVFFFGTPPPPHPTSPLLHFLDPSWGGAYTCWRERRKWSLR